MEYGGLRVSDQVPKLLAKLASGNLELLAGCKVLYCEDTGCQFILAENHDSPRHFIACLQGLFQAKAPVAQLNAQSLERAAPWPARAPARSAPRPEGRRRHRRAAALCLRLPFKREHQPVFANGKANARAPWDLRSPPKGRHSGRRRAMHSARPGRTPAQIRRSCACSSPGRAPGGDPAHRALRSRPMRRRPRQSDPAKRDRANPRCEATGQ